MPRKKVISGKKPKRKVIIATIKLKKELIAKWENGTRASDLAFQYGMAKSTISTILKNRDAIKAANVAKGVKILTSRKRSSEVEEVEKLLMIWINEKQLTGDSVSKAVICEKARHLYSDIKPDTPSVEEFKASRGWFANFKKRTGIDSVIRHGEAAGENKDAAEKYVEEFIDFVDREGYIPEQVFNCDEMGLFWKKMPKRTYITTEEKALPGHKPMKDKLTLLLCGNASGDFKIKPLLVYHSENPRIFKKNKVLKNKLSVMWRSNPKAWVTRQFFTEWFEEVFVPSVKKYLEEENLPFKALLVLDNAPAHPPELENLSGESGFIQVKFLPPSTTPFIQPMNQQIISNFKKLYTRAVFQKCFEVTSETELTLRVFWKNHFNILEAMRIIDIAWRQVSYKTMRSSWQKLWPASVPAKDLEGPQPVAEPEQDADVVEDIVSLGKSMGLVLDSEDVEELMKDHNIELSTKELQELHKEQQEEVAQEQSSNEGVGNSGGSIPSTDINELLAYWARTQILVEKWHPDIAVVNRSINLFDDTVTQHFRKIIKRRQKQITLNRFSTEISSGGGGSSASETQHSTSRFKRKKESTPGGLSPEIVMEGVSAS